LTDEERNAFIAATKPVFDKWVKELGADLYGKATADLKK
ncbi:MAG: C4-dicarboxylate ABC transporter, partial [Deltaproteobacteria bacterium CG_4_9_14_3_um_filter_51_14]